MKSLARACFATLLIVGIAAPAPAQAQSVNSRRAEANRIRAELDTAGEQLSMADEEFNLARLERERIEKELRRASSDADAAHKRAEESQAELRARVRNIYMHPSLYFAHWFVGGSDIARKARARSLSQSVVTSDEDLLLSAKRDAEEAEKAEAELSRLAEQALDKEEDLKRRRAAVNSRMGQQTELLSQVEGDIAEIIEADRQREAEEAARRAAAVRPTPAASAAPTPRPTPAPPGVTPAPRTPAPSPKDTNPSERESRAGPARPSASTAVRVAAEQIGKPYEWAGSGPDTFDCSGLTAYAWGKAGVSLPHSSRAQYASLPKVSQAELQPGDLVFYGNPIHHVGIYEGNGIMINAPQTGDYVKRSSIFRSDWAGAARP